MRCQNWMEFSFGVCRLPHQLFVVTKQKICVYFMPPQNQFATISTLSAIVVGCVAHRNRFLVRRVLASVSANGWMILWMRDGARDVWRMFDTIFVWYCIRCDSPLSRQTAIDALWMDCYLHVLTPCTRMCWICRLMSVGVFYGEVTSNVVLYTLY